MHDSSYGLTGMMIGCS